MTYHARLRLVTAFSALLSIILSPLLHAQGTRLPSLGTVRDVDYDRVSGTFVAGGDNGLYVWRPGSDEDPEQITRNQVAGLVVSPGGKELIYGDPASSSWVTLPGNEPVRPLNLRTHQGVDYEFSDDGETLFTVVWRAIDFESLVPSIHVLRSGDGTEIRRYEDIEAFSIIPWAAKLSPDGNFLAVYSLDEKLRVYDNQTGETVLEDSIPRSFGWHLIQFSRDGSLLAAKHPEGVRLYATNSWERITSLPPIWGQAFDLSEDGKFLATGDGRVLPISGGAPRFNLREQGNPDPLIQFIRFSPSGNLLLVMIAISNRLEVWDIDNANMIMQQSVGDLFVDRPFYADFLPDESGVVYSTSARSFAVASFSDSDQEPEEIVSLGQVAHLRFDSTDKHLQIIDLNQMINGQPTARSFNIESDSFTTLQAPNLQARAAFSPNGRWLGAIDRNGQGKLEIWEHGQGEPAVSFQASFNGFADVFAISDDGQTAAAGMPQGRISIWSGSSRRTTTSLPNQSFVRGLSFAPKSNHLAAMTSEGWVYVLDSSTREILWEKKVKSDFQFHLVPRFSPDGSWLAINGEDRTQVWNWETDTLIFEHPTRITTRSFAFSDDQRFLAIGAYSDAEVFQISPKRRLSRHTFTEFTEGISAVAFSHDLQSLAVGTGQGNLRIWSLEGRLPAPPLPTLQIIPETPDSVRLEWLTHPSQSLRLEASANLIDWLPLTVGEPGSFVVDTKLNQNRFFRLVSQ